MAKGIICPHCQSGLFDVNELDDGNLQIICAHCGCIVNREPSKIIGSKRVNKILGKVFDHMGELDGDKWDRMYEDFEKICAGDVDFSVREVSREEFFNDGLNLGIYAAGRTIIRANMWESSYFFVGSIKEVCDKLRVLLAKHK
jgi:hypothetical protein